MKFYVVQLITNTQGQDAPSIEVKDELENAAIRYHQLLAALHNAEDCAYAVVEILDEYGRIVGGYNEIVDHRPQPEPEAEA